MTAEDLHVGLEAHRGVGLGAPHQGDRIGTDGFEPAEQEGAGHAGDGDRVDAAHMPVVLASHLHGRRG